MNIDETYSALLEDVYIKGRRRKNRTGVDTRAIPSAMIQHDMADGFPILRKKKMSFKTSFVELVGFLHGMTDKKWYADNGCTIWDEWCNPLMIPSGLEGKEKHDYMMHERDLGPIYGSQWRLFNDTCIAEADQIVQLIETLRKNPDSRRMIVSAWNPLQLDQMALPPCHFAFQVIVMGEEMHLNWSQRSVDLFLGLPYNILFYGTLLELLCKQFDYTPGILTGFLGDTHIYENHLEQAREYLDRSNNDPLLPELYIRQGFESILDISVEDAQVINYRPQPAIKAPVAI